MPDMTMEGETEALLGLLERDELACGVVRTNAMMAGAVSYLARVTGHAPTPGEPMAASGALH